MQQLKDKRSLPCKRLFFLDLKSKKKKKTKKNRVGYLPQDVPALLGPAMVIVAGIWYVKSVHLLSALNIPSTQLASCQERHK